MFSVVFTSNENFSPLSANKTSSDQTRIFDTIKYSIMWNCVKSVSTFNVQSTFLCGLKFLARCFRWNVTLWMENCTPISRIFIQIFHHHKIIKWHINHHQWEQCQSSYIQLNSINLMPDNPEIPSIWCFRRVVTRPEVSALPEKGFVNEIAGSWEHVQKCLQECLYINCFGASWSLVSCSTYIFSYENARKQRRGPWWPWTNR